MFSAPGISNQVSCFLLLNSTPYAVLTGLSGQVDIVLEDVTILLHMDVCVCVCVIHFPVIFKPLIASAGHSLWVSL